MAPRSFGAGVTDCLTSLRPTTRSAGGRAANRRNWLRDPAALAGISLAARAAVKALERIAVVGVGLGLGLGLGLGVAQAAAGNAWHIPESAEALVASMRAP